VPSRLFPAFEETSLTRGWQVENGAKGACPALGVTITDSTGAQLDPKINCGDVIPALQAQSIKDFKPSIVVAWSRYEMADRLSVDGKHLVAGTAPFWAAQRASLRKMTDRLASGGAKVVIVKTDRPGQGMATRCTPSACAPILRRLIDEDGIRVAWNKILDEEAARDPRITVIAIDDVYCKDAAEPCNDKQPDGTFARPDGSHFSHAFMPIVAEALAARIASAIAPR
jgi:SGNH domain (fused to AT3 domains)